MKITFFMLLSLALSSISISTSWARRRRSLGCRLLVIAWSTRTGTVNRSLGTLIILVGVRRVDLSLCRSAVRLVAISPSVIAWATYLCLEHRVGILARHLLYLCPLVIIRRFQWISLVVRSYSSAETRTYLLVILLRTSSVIEWILSHRHSIVVARAQVVISWDGSFVAEYVCRYLQMVILWLGIAGVGVAAIPVLKYLSSGHRLRLGLRLCMWLWLRLI